MTTEDQLQEELKYLREFAAQETKRADIWHAGFAKWRAFAKQYGDEARAIVADTNTAACVGFVSRLDTGYQKAMAE